MRLYGLLGGKYVSVCKVCGKLGGSGGMLPREILFGPIFIVMACESMYKSLPHFYMLQVTGS